MPVYEADADFKADFAPTASRAEPAGRRERWTGRARELVVGVLRPARRAGRRIGVVRPPAGKTPMARAGADAIGDLAEPPSDDAARRTAATAMLRASRGARRGVVARRAGRCTSALRFTGAERLSVLPFAKTTPVTVAGDWPTPSFDGGFLPETRQLGASGFSAAWSVPFIARGVSDHGGTDALSLDQLGAKDLGVSLRRRQQSLSDGARGR